MTKRTIYYSLILFTILLSSCKKSFFDINTDPSNPTKVAVSQILPTAESSLAGSLGISGGNTPGLGQVLGTYVHQLCSNEDPDAYGATGSDYYLNLSWDNLYAGNSLATNSGVNYTQGTLLNLQNIITEATAQGNTQYAGIAKVLTAYTYSQLVDIFGNVPFSQALQLQQGIINPKFDSGSVIYPQLMSMLDSGIADLKNTTAPNLLKPGADDIIYGGSISNWVRAANTIKLKLLLQQRLIKNVTSDVNALITGNDLISSTSQSFLLHYGPNGSSDDRNPGFSDYYATQKTNFISPWFYSILKGYNPRLFKNIVDPRLPYYFYEQQDPTAADNDGNKVEYRDSGFISIVFASIGPNGTFVQDNSMTVLGLYPVGGRYDDGLPTPSSGGANKIVKSSDATGAAPYRFITYADVLFMEAELMKTGVISGDPEATLQAALVESMKQVDFVTGLVNTSQSVPNLSGSAAATNYISSIMSYYEANPSQQLEIIMTEKWITAFGQCADQYTDYRRTQFPVLFNPNDPTVCPGGFYQPPVNGDPSTPGPQLAVPVRLTTNYPLSLPFGQNELDGNQNAPAQKQDPSTYKVFWMP